MDIRSGELYESTQAAIDAGVPEKNVVEVKGSKEEVEKLSSDIKKFREIETVMGQKVEVETRTIPKV